jgi:plasmid replication initiation protein
MVTFKQFLLNEGNKVKSFYTSRSFELTAKRARTGGVTLTDELGYKTRASGGGYDKFGTVLGNWIQDNL